MDDFGKRLKEERERLGLSQAKFAEACGVGKTAQYTYEKGDREPSYSYMDTAEKLGVDAHYVFTGTRTGKDWAYARAYSTFLYTIEMLLGLKEGELEKLCKQRVELDDKVDWFKNNEPAEQSGNVNFGPWIDGVAIWLATSTKPDRCLDLDLLSNVLAGIETQAEKTGMKLTADKKAKSAIMLYRAFKASGKFDPKMIKEVLSLAS
ncbi:MAG: helix-turn-helix transcriptional regulator [Gallionella sp.]